ncbi:MAG: cupredoxin domain-containing protein [Nanoarchaeota archaeon]
MKKIIYVLGLISILLLIAGCAKIDTTTSVPATTGNVPSTTEKAVSETPKATDSAPNVVGETHNVIVESFKFAPVDLEVKVGDMVEWVNKDSTAHTITLDNGLLDEKLPSGGTASYTFKEKGTFTYYCALHPSMKGTVVVS